MEYIQMSHTINESTISNNIAKTFKQDNRVLPDYSLLLSSASTYELSTKATPSQIICKDTGITIQISIPFLESLPQQLDWSSPFSSINNCLTIAKLPVATLQSYDLGILSALIITIYSHYDLLRSKDNRVVTNAMLRTCSLNTLLQAITLSTSFTKKNVNGLPSYNIEYNVHKDGVKSLDKEFHEFVKTIKTTMQLNASASTNSDGIVFVKGSFDINSAPSNGIRKIRTNTKSDYEKQWDTNFTEHKAKAKESFRVLTIPLISLDYKKMVTVLKAVLAQRNILTTSTEVKTKLITRLTQAAMELPVELSTLTENIIKFIEFSNNKDFTVDAVVEMERASDSMDKPKPRTLAEILAAKRALASFKVE